MRIPPDSSGKRIMTNHTAEILYSSKNPAHLWRTDGEYTFGDGWTFTISDFYEDTSTSGILYVVYARDSVNGDLSPTIGTDIVNGVDGNVAVVDSFNDVYVNATHIVGGNNHHNRQFVDDRGSANVRFAEGAPQVDAFGKLRTSGATLLGEYAFSNSVLPDKFSSKLVGSGTVSWDKDQRAAIIECGTANGDSAQHVTNTYHHYFSGSSHLMMMTAAISDSGKTNVNRLWGLIDDNNGVGFTLRDSTLGVVIRSDVSGTVSENLITQANWSVDKLDGTGPSGMEIDLTKDNVYWIDMQWLGAGRIRFGVYYKGVRVVCHEDYNANENDSPYMGTASLPVTIEQQNVGAAGSTSQIRAFCIAVWTESDLRVQDTADADHQSIDSTIPNASVGPDEYFYIGSLRPTPYYDNGRKNRSVFFPASLVVNAFDASTGEPVNAEVELVMEPKLSGANYTQTSADGITEYDVGPYHTGAAGTTNWYGHLGASYKVFVRGFTDIDLSEIYTSLTGGAFKNYALDGDTISQTVTDISKGSTTSITISSGIAFKEGEVIDVDGVPTDHHSVTFSGSTGITDVNGQTYYLKITSATTADLYADAALTTPVNSTGWAGTYDADSATASGDFGHIFTLGLIGKKYVSTGDIRLLTKLTWKEIQQ